MKVLVVGSGGREHALAWQAARSELVSEVLVAPGNGGTATEAGVRNVAVSATDIEKLLELAHVEKVGLTIVGPEQPLVAGIVDRFTAEGLKCFGPTRQAAQLEGSKAFAKDFLSRNQIPTASYQTFTAIQPAIEYLRRQAMPIVIKADGLAAGKGVIVAATVAEAEAAVRNMLEDNAFGDAGARVVIEEFLRGEEASFIALVDGDDILPLASSQDHKTRDEGDRGPNTGGMGAYSPAPVVTPGIHDKIMNQVMKPTIAGLKAEGIRYRGFLYAGLMIADDEPRVLEFNCRFGDPETQPVLFRLRSDLVALCMAALEGNLAGMNVQWDPRASLGVVIAAEGYPGAYEKGRLIHGLEAVGDANTKVFHAGTRVEHGQVVTNGGRVLCVVALGDTVTSAQYAAYKAAERLYFEGAFFRRDIGHRAVTRESATRA